MKIDTGQDKLTWHDEWRGHTPESEIQMWDFYGLRPWILKYAPRYGTIVEAGCGLGRYVFYLSELGLNIKGVDFSEEAINFLNDWKRKQGFKAEFDLADVQNLPYEDNSLSGYISLGVVEHFIEGPMRPLAEAFRVLRPGGVAIISTPSVSFNIFVHKAKRIVKTWIKRLLRYELKQEPFFQYWYRPRELKNYVQNTGLKVVKYGGADLLYVFCEMGQYSGENLRPGSFAYRFSDKFENSFLNTFGAQSITISIRIASEMYCFLCGRLSVSESSLVKYDVPLCEDCSNTELSFYYLRNRRPSFASSYLISPPVKPPTKEMCEFCGRQYDSHPLFEDFGFTKMVCTDCLRIPEVNIFLSNTSVKPVWRKRGRQ